MVCKISSTERWFVHSTVTPARISSALTSACRSEKARTRSGSRARIRSTRKVVKPPTLGRPVRRAGDPDDPLARPERIADLDVLGGETDDAPGQERLGLAVHVALA